MKILILTLCGQRDEIVDELIAGHLRKYGHEVHVHNYAKAGFLSVPYMKPDVVVSPFPGGEFKHGFVQRCKEWGCKVIVRRGEAGASTEIFKGMDKERQIIILGNWDYSSYVDLELVWGQEFADLLARKGSMPHEKLKACGAFTLDAYFLPEAKRDRYHERTILFATGFACADYVPERSECGLPTDSAYHKILYKREKETRALWIASIKEFAKWFGKECRINLKVRPGERIDEYVRELGDIVNIYPAATSSLEALKETDILVHSGSTMAIEAHLLGIPSFNFHNINDDSLLASVCPNIEGYKELEWSLAMANIYGSNIDESIYAKLQEHLYGKIDGKACERAAGFIHEHIKDKEIKTNIPDNWPSEVKYSEDGVSAEKQDGYIYWSCIVCKKIYYAEREKQIAKCPYCGVSLKRTDGHRLTVLSPLVKSIGQYHKSTTDPDTQEEGHYQVQELFKRGQ